MAERCTERNRDGAPCAARPLPNSTRCPWHTDGLAEKRKSWSAAGGRAKSNEARAKRLLPEAMDAAELAGLLSGVFRRLVDGEIEPNLATAAGSLARSMIEIARAAHVEDRLVEIERQLGIERSAS